MIVNHALRRALIWGAAYALVVAVAGALIGWAAVGERGIFGAVLAAALAAIFLGLTAASILIANRVAKPGDIGVFFGIVLGGWLLKFILFFVVAFALRGAPWFDPVVFGATMIVVVVGTLVIDLVAVTRTRPPDIGAHQPDDDASDPPAASEAP